MKNLRTYITKTRIYKGGALGAAVIGTLATLAGGSASAMSYTSYSQNNFSSYNHHQRNHHHRHDHRQDDRDDMRRYY